MPGSPHHLADEIERSIDELDQILREVRAGMRGARHFHELEERGQVAASRVVQAFRGSDARPITADIVPGRNGGVWAR